LTIGLPNATSKLGWRKARGLDFTKQRGRFISDMPFPHHQS